MGQMDEEILRQEADDKAMQDALNEMLNAGDTGIPAINRALAEQMFESPLRRRLRMASAIAMAAVISIVLGPLMALLGLHLLGVDIDLTWSTWGGLALIFTALRIAV